MSVCAKSQLPSMLEVARLVRLARLARLARFVRLVWLISWVLLGQ